MEKQIDTTPPLTLTSSESHLWLVNRRDNDGS